VPSRIVLRMTRDLDDREERLPDRRVADGEIAELDCWPTRGRMSAQPLRIYVAVERALARTADEQPVLGYRRSITPAIAIPNPTHIVAIP
jgi:hypothetical protein